LKETYQAFALSRISTVDRKMSAVTAVDNDNDVRHSVPSDKSHVHIWMLETATHDGVLTQDGISQIAHHKYHAGQNTILDGLLNPLWAYLTECLPYNMAPNLVTLLGGVHCLAAYVLTWYFTMDFNASSMMVVVPCWVLLANAYSQLAYYTLDCMDGKQARRTNSSSPVGQLFDHGIDCLCILAHLSSVHAYLGCGSGAGIVGSAAASSSDDLNLSYWFFLTQASLQVSFFLAQWEEYYTGVLPHCCGQVGVTETNYGLAVASFVNGMLLHMHGPQRFATFYSQPLLPLLFASSNSNSTMMMIRAVLVRFCNAILDVSTESLQALQVKQGVVIVWVALLSGLMLLCLQRVFYHCCYYSKTENKKHHHDRHQHYDDYSGGGVKLFLSAVSKLATPIAISASPFFIPLATYQDRPGTLRLVHLSVGLCMALLTIKLIVFAMSRQAYAAVQGDGIPILLAVVWLRNDTRLTLDGVHLLFLLLTLWFVYRIASWTNAALTQLCRRLQIHLFSITPPPRPPPPAEKQPLALKASSTNKAMAAALKQEEKGKANKQINKTTTNKNEHSDLQQQQLREQEEMEHTTSSF
jgi:CDP-alcohol phosphatidyltransferase